MVVISSLLIFFDAVCGVTPFCFGLMNSDLQRSVLPWWEPQWYDGMHSNVDIEQENIVNRPGVVIDTLVLLYDRCE